MTNNLDQEHTFVIDVTKHRPLLDTFSLIGSIKEYVRLKFDTAKMNWFVRVDQKDYFANEVATVDNDSDLILPKGEKIRNLISQLSQNGSSGHIFHVLSYDRSVLTDAFDLNGNSFVVTTGFLNDIHKSIGENSDANFAKDGLGVASDLKPIPLNDAIDLVKKVLRSGSHFSQATAFRLAALRTEMTRIDSRAKKNPSDYSSVSLMRSIVNDGLQKKWLKLDKSRGSGAEHVWLVEHDSLDNTLLSEKSVSEDLDKKKVKIEAVGSKSETRTEPRRCTLMEMKLRERGIGSPVVPRKYLFDAVELIFAEITEPITSSQLIVLARKKAKDSANNAGYNRSQNWEAIGDCFLRMMLSAKVLIKPDGTPILNGIGAYSKPVVKVLPDFRDLCEAFLLEHIIHKIGDIALNDVFALGLALYQKGGDDPTPKEEIIERTDILLQLLFDAERIAVDDEDNISVVKK